MASSTTTSNTLNGINLVSLATTPQAQDDVYTNQALTEDNLAQFTIDVMANDLGGKAKTLYSLDNDAAGQLAPTDLVYRDDVGLAQSSLNGATIRITSDGKVSYDASTLNDTFKADLQHLGAGGYAEDSFIYAIQLGNGTLSWATATVRIYGVNDAPVLSAVTGAVFQEAADASAQDIAPVQGTLTVADPDIGDHLHAFETGTPTLTWSGGALEVGQLAALTSALVTGRLSIGPDVISNGTQNTIGYTWDPGQANLDFLAQGQTLTVTYSVKVNDGHVDSAAQIVSFTIQGTNDAPVITGGDASGAVIEAGDLDDGSAVDGSPQATGTLTASDVDSGATQAWSITGPTTYGTMAVDADTGTWTYSLDNSLATTQALAEGDTVTQTFTATVTDDKGATATQTVTITITGTNDSPVISGGDVAGSVMEAGNADDGATVGGSPTATGTLVATDVDTGATQAWSIIGPSTYGTMAIDADTGTWTYSLDNGLATTQALAEGETATQTFTATVTDDKGATATQTVTITITGTNDSPVITGGDVAGAVTEAGNEDDGTTVDGSPTATGTLVATDVDTGATQSWSITGPTTYGTMTIDADTGTWTYSLNNSLGATQALAEGETATQTFTATVTDDKGATATQTVTITITGTNDSPVISGGDVAGAVTEAGNADDGATVDGSPTATGTLTASDVDTGATQAWSIDGPTTYGTMAIDADTGTWTYSLDNSLATTQALAEGETATQSFTATVTDDKGATATQTVTITITGTNDSPVISGGDVAGAVTEAGNADDGATVDGSPTAIGTLTASDVDTGSTQAWSIDGPTTYGTMAIDADTGTWTYSLNNSLATTQALAEGDTATQTFTATVTDDKGATATQTVTITITGTNDAPAVTGAVSGNATEDGASVTLDALVNASDVDSGTTLFVVDVPSTLPAGVSYDASTHSFTLDPTASAYQHLNVGDSTTVTVAYGVSDGAATTPAEVSWTVTGTNDAPTTSAVTLAAIAEDSGARLITQAELLANASDVDNASADLTATNLAIAAGLGTLVDNHDGSWTYTPAVNDDTQVSFSYQVSDGHLSTTGSATLDITPVEDASITDIAFAVSANPGGNAMPSGTLGQLSVPNGSGSYTYQLTSLSATVQSTGASVTIGSTAPLAVSSTGVVSASGLDVDRVYAMTVQVSQGGSSYSETFRIITGTSGTDTNLNSPVTGDDMIVGLAGNDVIFAGGGNDSLFGQNGNDQLHGGTGNDTLTGGNGNDTFVFDTALDAATNVDHITDFATTGQTDMVWLSHAIFSSLATAGSSGGTALNPADFLGVSGTGDTVAAGSAHLIYDAATGNLFYDSDGGDAAHRTLFAVFDVKPTATELQSHIQVGL